LSYFSLKKKRGKEKGGECAAGRLTCSPVLTWCKKPEEKERKRKGKGVGSGGRLLFPSYPGGRRKEKKKKGRKREEGMGIDSSCISSGRFPWFAAVMKKGGKKRGEEERGTVATKKGGRKRGNEQGGPCVSLFVSFNPSGKRKKKEIKGRIKGGDL